MKKLAEYRIYALFVVSILALLVFEVLYSEKPDQAQWAIIDIPQVDHMYIDFPCNVFVSKSADETIVVEGRDILVKRIRVNEFGKVLYLSEEKSAFNSIFNRIMLSEQSRPNLYIRINDPCKIIANDKLTVITSEPLSQYRSGFLSSLKNLKELLTSTLLVG